MPTKSVASPQPFTVRRSGIQGKGCFANRDIRQGERVAEYTGERIGWKEADARYDDDHGKRHHTFLFSVNSRTVIDAAVDGNDSRFINHSCDPNCEAIDEKGRIYIEAIRDIRKGEELFYDYAYARDKDTTEADEKLYVCLCGSPRCRGSILEPVKQKKLAPHHVAARHPHSGASDGTGGGRAPGKRSGTKRSASKGGATKRPATADRGTKSSAKKAAEKGSGARRAGATKAGAKRAGTVKRGAKSRPPR